MLYWIDDDHEITEIPRSRRAFYNAGMRRLSNAGQADSRDYIQELRNYINRMIDETMNNTTDTQFIVPGWKTRGSWGDAVLSIIWDKACERNEEI
ncbi:MAG: hypothetical protein ACM3S4_12000 [Burkholderiales bacterium]